jgi:hypothetical protein
MHTDKTLQPVAICLLFLVPWYSIDLKRWSATDRKLQLVNENLSKYLYPFCCCPANGHLTIVQLFTEKQSEIICLQIEVTELNRTNESGH